MSVPYGLKFWLGTSLPCLNGCAAYESATKTCMRAPRRRNALHGRVFLLDRIEVNTLASDANFRWVTTTGNEPKYSLDLCSTSDEKC
jgi:hypothetical protein